MPGQKCSDVMTKDVVCCTATDMVHLAAQSMKAQDVGSIPVVDSQDKKRLIGIVTDRVRAHKVVAAGLDPNKTTVESVMSRTLLVCKTDDDWHMAIEAMGKH